MAKYEKKNSRSPYKKTKQKKHSIIEIERKGKEKKDISTNE